MTSIDEGTKISLGLVIALVVVATSGAVTGAFYIAGIESRLALLPKIAGSLNRIEKKQGLPQTDFGLGVGPIEFFRSGHASEGVGHVGKTDEY